MTSPVFKAMFLSIMKEKFDNQIPVNGHDLATIKSMLKYMYGKKMSDRELTPELLAAADFYEVERLSMAVKNKLLDTINNNNVANIWKTAYLTGTEDLCHSAIAFIAKNWNSLNEDEDIQNLVAEYPKLLFLISKLLSECHYRSRKTDDPVRKVTKVE